MSTNQSADLRLLCPALRDQHSSGLYLDADYELRRPVVDSQFDLQNVVEAHRRLELRQNVGKVVLRA